MIKRGFQSKMSEGKNVHHFVKKGYTKAHIKNSKKKQFKHLKDAIKLNTGAQLEEGDNNIDFEEQ